MTHIYIESSIKRLDVKGVTRIYTALSNVKVRTISSLCKMDEEEFTSVKGIGMGLCVAVKEYLEAHGLKFGMTDMEISAYHEAYLAERKHTAQSKQHEKEEKKKMEEIADVFAETSEHITSQIFDIADKLAQIPTPILVNAAKTFLSFAVSFVDSVIAESEKQKQKA